MTSTTISISIISITLFIIGILGFIFTSTSSEGSKILKLVLILELILLGGTLLTLGTAWDLNDLDGILIGLYLIVLAGVESIVGLTLIMQYYSSKSSSLIT